MVAQGAEGLALLLLKRFVDGAAADLVILALKHAGQRGFEIVDQLAQPGQHGVDVFVGQCAYVNCRFGQCGNHVPLVAAANNRRRDRGPQRRGGGDNRAPAMAPAAPGSGEGAHHPAPR